MATIIHRKNFLQEFLADNYKGQFLRIVQQIYKWLKKKKLNNIFNKIKLYLNF